jgi:hypothetical protein
MLPKKDRAYNESRFSEVRDAIVANSYQKVWGGRGRTGIAELRSHSALC